MRAEPNLKDWAEALIYGITGDDSYNPKLVAWVEAELKDLSNKYYQKGFEDGDRDGWHTALEQDVEYQQTKREFSDYEKEWKPL